jgi:hypothetical protein
MGSESVPPRFGEIASDALRYWEPRRALYNLVLAGVVAGPAAGSDAMSDSRPRLSRWKEPG